MLEFEPLHSDFGVRLPSVDMRGEWSADLIEVISAVIDTYSFVCLPDQPLGDTRQLAFTRRLGEPEPNHVVLGQEGRIEYFGTIGNVTDDGRRLGSDDKRVIFQTGNNMWHSDSSFREVPSAFSIMCVYEVPDEGAETEFVSTRAAYGRLSEERKKEIDDLVAVHDYVFSRSKVGHDAVSPSHAASLPPVQQKLVRTNPSTDEKNYYVGSHAKEIVGRSTEDGRALLDDLLLSATREEYVYSHTWRPGDLVIWDNRCLLHRGRGYDADRYRRLMRQTRVRGTASTLAE